MAGKLELETLLIRLKGDASNYLAMLDEVIKRTKSTAAQIKASLGQAGRMPKTPRVPPGGGGPGIGGEGGGRGGRNPFAARYRMMTNSFKMMRKQGEEQEKAERASQGRRYTMMTNSFKMLRRQRNEEAAEGEKKAKEGASREIAAILRRVNAAGKAGREQEKQRQATENKAQRDQRVNAKSINDFRTRLRANSLKLEAKTNEKAYNDEVNNAKKLKDFSSRLRTNSQKLAERHYKKEDKAETDRKQKAFNDAMAQANKFNKTLAANRKRVEGEEKARMNFSQRLKDNSARLATRQGNKAEKEETARKQKAFNNAMVEARRFNNVLATNRKKVESEEKAATNRRQTLMANSAKVHTRIMEREQRQREAAVKRANKQQAADATKAQRNIQQEHARTSQAISDLARNATMVGAAQAAAFTASMTALGKASLDAFSDFNLAMTEATSIMSDGAENAAEMTRVAKELSLTSKFGAAESAKAYYNLASAGLSAQQSIKALPQVQAFATAGAFDLSKATELATSAQTAIGLRSQDAQQNLVNLTRVTDVLSMANNLAQGTTLDFANALTTDAAATAKIYNKELEEVVATLAVYAERGITGRLAGGHFARSLRLLAGAAVRNGEAHKELGFSLYETDGRMKSMVDIVKNLEQVLEGLSPKARASVLAMLGFDALQQKAILPLIGTSKRIAEFQAKLQEAGGTTQDVADKQMQAFANQMKLVQNSVNLAAIEIGEILAPIMVGFGSVIKDAVNAFLSLSPATRAAIVSVALFTTVFVALSGVILAALYAINVFSAGALFIAGLIITSFAAAGVTTGLLVNHLGGFQKVFDSIRKKGQQAWEWLKPVRQALTELADTLMVELGAVFDHLIQMGTDAFSTSDWENMKESLIYGIELVEFSLINFDRTARLIFGGLVIEANKLLNVTIAMAPILQGISQMATGIQFPIPQLTPANIGELQKDLDKLANELGGDFAQFQMKRAAQRLQDAFAEQFWQDVETEAWQKELINKMEAMAEGAQKGGEDAGNSYNDGLNKGLKKFKIDATLFGSAEALARISEYTERILNPEAFEKKKGRPSNIPKMDIVNRQAGANTEVDLLREIRDNLKQQNRGPDVRVRPADIG